MESFASLRKHLVMCGIKIAQKSPKNHPINARNSIVFILLCVSTTLIAISLNEAKTFDESTDILFRSVSTGTCTILYVIIAWKTSKLYEFINGVEDIVKTSEFYHT